MKWMLGVSFPALIAGWAGTGTIPAATITLDDSIIKYFPPETKGIAFVDVAALRAAPLVKSILDQKQFQTLPPAFKDFIDGTGFDIRRDLDRVTVGTINATEKLFVVEARYDKFKAVEYVRHKGTELETYLGRDIYRNSAGAVTFLDNLFLFGTENAIKQGLDQITYPGSSKISNDLLNAIRTIEAGNQIWAVSNGLMVDFPVPELRDTPAAQIFTSLRRGTYQLRIDHDVHVRALAEFTDANTANNLRDMARGFIAVLKLRVGNQQPELLQMLDGVQISSNGSSIVAQIDEPGDLLMKFRPTIEKRLQQ